MRIMTYNIRSGRNMENVLAPEEQIKVIKGLAPDICALNEVRVHTTDVGGMDIAAEYGEKLGMEHRFARTIDINGGEYGIAMLSRYPIVSSRIVPVPDLPEEERGRRFEPRTVLACEIDTPEGRLCAITSHFGLSDGERKNAAATVLSLVSETDMPVVFMGDLNAKPGDAVIESLRAALYDTAGDTPLSFPSSGPEIRIDYIFTSRHFKKADMQTFATQASDHLPAYIDTGLVR